MGLGRHSIEEASREMPLPAQTATAHTRCCSLPCKNRKIVAAIVGGYFGASHPHAIEYRDGTTLTWTSATAPEATLNLLAGALLIAAVVILPALVLLYRVFKSAHPAG